jgi:hypothetical protein
VKKARTSRSTPFTGGGSLERPGGHPRGSTGFLSSGRHLGHSKSLTLRGVGSGKWPRLQRPSHGSPDLEGRRGSDHGVLRARRAGLSASARKLTRRPWSARRRPRGASEAKHLVARAACGARRGNSSEHSEASRSRARFGAGFGRSQVCPYLLPVAEVSEWSWSKEVSLGRGRADGQRPSPKRVTAAGEGPPGTGRRRQSRWIGDRLEKSRSWMEGAPG